MAIDNIKFTYDATVVYVAVTDVKENVTNAVNSITPGTTEDVANTTLLINLNKVEDRFTITGHINNGKLNAAETYTTAKDKKNGLKTIMAKGHVLTMNWEGTDYSVAVDKYEIAYVARDDDNMTQDGESVYDVVISSIVGDDII